MDGICHKTCGKLLRTVTRLFLKVYIHIYTRPKKTTICIITRACSERKNQSQESGAAGGDGLEMEPLVMTDRPEKAGDSFFFTKAKNKNHTQKSSVKR